MTREVWVRPASKALVERFPHARQAVCVRTTSEPRRPQAKPREQETHYYVVTGPRGTRRLGPEQLARLIRNHWGIENRLHHVLDRTLREDAQKTRVQKGPLLLSLLRKLALVLIEPNRRDTGRSRPEIMARLAAYPRRAARLIQRVVAQNGIILGAKPGRIACRERYLAGFASAAVLAAAARRVLMR